MDFQLTNEQKALKALCQEIAKEFKPFVDKANRENEVFPPEIKRRVIKRLKEAGLLGLTLPTEYGGQGRLFIDLVLAMEEEGQAKLGHRPHAGPEMVRVLVFFHVACLDVIKLTGRTAMRGYE